MHDDTLALVFSDRMSLAVARRVEMPLLAAVAATPDRRWVRDEFGYCGRMDLATVRTRMRIDGFEADLELTPWSETTTELVLRPAARAPHRWGARRRRRWYAAAHETADTLRAVLVARRPPRIDQGSAATEWPRMAG